MDKAITTEEFLALLNDQDVELERVPSALEQMLGDHREDMKKEREQREIEITEMRRLVMSAVQKMAETQQGTDASLGRMEKIVSSVVSGQRQAPPDYAFHVERDSNGQIAVINATKPTH